MNRIACLVALVAMSLWCGGCGSDSGSTDGQSSDSETGSQAASGEEVEVASAVELEVPPAEEDGPEPVARPSLLLKFMTAPLADAVDAQSAALPDPIPFLIPRLGGPRGGGRGGPDASPPSEN